LIDTQVHFREPGLTHKETIGTGSAAAVAGGVTTYFEMPNTVPNTTDAERLAEKLRIAAATSHADYAFFVGAARENLDRLAELEALPGCAGIKIFLGSSTGSLLLDDHDDLVVALRNGSRRVAAHCEDEAMNRAKREAYEGRIRGVEDHPSVRDSESALVATERFIAAGRATGRPIHILHVSTADELSPIRRAKEDGVDVTCEITPQHLWFCADDYARLGTRIQQNPPIRSRMDRFALRAALQHGFFDVFGSDHAPHTLEEKSKPYPTSSSGMPGVQTSLRVLLALGASPEMIARMFSQKPALIFGIENKGWLREGFDADLILVEPEIRETVKSSELLSKCAWSPFEGENLPLGATHTIVGGRIAYADGALMGEPSGRVVRFGAPA
ncbi:dihydroorotase, partial [bacterium]